MGMYNGAHIAQSRFLGEGRDMIKNDLVWSIKEGKAILKEIYSNTHVETLCCLLCAGERISLLREDEPQDDEVCLSRRYCDWISTLK